MAEKLILGIDGYSRFSAGYPINVNDAKIITGTISDNQTGTVLPGDLLVLTDKAHVFKTATSASDKIAGIATATNVKTDYTWPQSSSEVGFKAKDRLGVQTEGEIAVKLYGTAPTPGAAVYYDISNKAFTIASGGVACTNMTFSGMTEGTLTVVKIRY